MAEQECLPFSCAVAAAAGAVLCRADMWCMPYAVCGKAAAARAVAGPCVAAFAREAAAEFCHARRAHHWAMMNSAWVMAAAARPYCYRKGSAERAVYVYLLHSISPLCPSVLSNCHCCYRHPLTPTPTKPSDTRVAEDVPCIEAPVACGACRQSSNTCCAQYKCV